MVTLLLLQNIVNYGQKQSFQRTAAILSSNKTEYLPHCHKPRQKETHHLIDNYVDIDRHNAQYAQSYVKKSVATAVATDLFIYERHHIPQRMSPPKKAILIVEPQVWP